MIGESFRSMAFLKKTAKVIQLLFVLIFAFSLIGIQPGAQVKAEASTLSQASALAVEGETKIAVISDFGVAISDTHKANIATLIKNWAPEAVVTGGDNYHEREPYCTSYSACIAGYNSNTAGYTDFVSSGKFFPSYGNHDAGHSTDYTNYFSYLPTSPSANRLYYDVVVGNIHFWVLNGNVNLSSSGQAAWLAANVPNSTAAWNIAVVHQAPYGTGFYGDIASTQLPYQDYGIDFVISGHNHHYERLEKNGVRYFIAGRAGVTEGGRTCDGTGSTATSEFCAGTQNPPLDNYGYMQIVASETAISLSFVNESGVVKDTFSKTTVVNLSPVLDPIGNKSVNEQEQLSFIATATDADVPGQTLTFSLVGAPTGAGITAGGLFTWTPTEAQGPGSYPFTVRVCDNGSPSKCDEELITVTVNEVNVAPVLGTIGPKSVNELALLSFTASATDADLPPNTKTFSLANGTGGLVPTNAAINSSSGAFTWMPTEAEGPGTFTFDVCVSDGTASDCETIVVTVKEVNVAPVLDSIGDKSIAQFKQLTFTATASDVDLPKNSLTYSYSPVTTGASIGLTTGVFTWTPTADQGPSIYTFNVCVSDGALNDCESVAVTVTEPINTLLYIYLPMITK